MILGLDCSTVTCGWAFYDGTSIVDAGFIDTSKLETNKEKAFYILEHLGKNPNFISVSQIRLEAALSGFMRGRTSQQVVIKLARFNAVLEYILGEKTGLPVVLIGAMTARKKVLGKAFIKGMTAKEYVRQELPKRFPEIKRFEQLNKKGEWNVKNGDMYDAVVISSS
jgi:hypothetical protein